MFFYDPVQLRPHGALIACAAETLVVWTPGQPQYYGHPAHPYTHSWIHCDGRWIQRVLRQSRLPGGVPLSLPYPELVERALLEVYAELTTQTQPDRKIVCNLLENLLRAAARMLTRKHDAPGIPARLLDLKHHIELSYRMPLTLEELARRAHLSVPHLCAEFKRCFKTPVIDYVIRLRLHEAADLLYDRNLNITEIARRVGYDDIYYFSRLFRKHFGMSPRALRQQRTRARPPRPPSLA